MRKDPQAVPLGPIPDIVPETVPKYVKINLAQAVFEAIQADFQRPEIQKDYRRWKAARQAAADGGAACR